MDIQDFVIRPITESDLDSICYVASNAGYGFTSLPNNREHEAERIKLSIQSFACLNKKTTKATNPGLYLFVMETKTQEFAGLCGIKAGVGINAPFYSFKLTTTLQTSEQLNKSVSHTTLVLVNEFKGAAEFISLFLDKQFRGKRRADFLSRSRLLFIAEFSAMFADTIISEIRGVSDNNGYSPFWDAVGRKFFAMDFADADYLTATASKQFIADLMPKHPLYVDFLPQSAQDVIGQAHALSAPAKHILETEGLKFSGYVDIFDAGPLLVGDKTTLRTVANSSQSNVVAIETTIEDSAGELAIIGANTTEFRIKLGMVKLIADSGVAIDASSAQLLKVKVGDIVRWCKF